MNILIATISTFSFKAQEYTYSILIGGKMQGEITAVHTNESIVKSLSKLGINIDKIVALCSYAVLNNRDERFDNKTALEYYSEKAVKEFINVEIIPLKIQIDENTSRPNSEIINDVCQAIHANDTVYLDIAGGQRTITNITQLLSKILQYKGIDNALSLYADIQNKEHYVTDASEFATLSNIADAVNEFATTGKSTQLNNCLKSRHEFKDLLSAMNDFSERIMLCDIGKLDDTLFALKESIVKLENNKMYSTVEQTVVMQLLPIIKEKLLVEQNNFDYKQIIEWCLNNGLIQQAVTIYTEKMPVYYFKKGILQEYVDLDKVNPTLGNSKESCGFYEELFNKFSGGSKDKLISEFQIFVKKIIDDNTELTAKKIIKQITENQQVLSNNLINASNNLIKFIQKQYKTVQSPINKKFGHNITPKKTQTRLYTLIVPKSLSGFLNNLKTNPEYLHYFVYNNKTKWENQPDNSIGTYEKKTIALQKVRSVNKALYSMMSHYLALKIMRNRMNHASEEVLTNDEQIAVNYLLSEGFDINFSITAITNIIKSGLNIV